MLLPLKAICDKKKTRKDGTSLIYIQYCYSSEHRTLLNTEIAIPPPFWNKKRGCISDTLPPEFGDVDKHNEALTKMFRLVEDLISLGGKKNITDLGRFVKETFTPTLSIEALQANDQQLSQVVTPKVKDKTLSVFSQLNDYMGVKEKKNAPSTMAIIRGMRQHLQAYETFSGKKLTFASFDYAFYEDFIDYLTFDYVHKGKRETVVGLQINTIGKTVKHLRRFLTDRVRRKIINPIDLTDFKVITEDTDAIYLTLKDIKAIYHTDLSKHPHLVPYRKLFVLACLTGLRFSDFSTLQPEDLRGDMLHNKMLKSDYWVVIPLRKEAKEIFIDYFENPPISLTNQEFNRHIKTIGKLAGITDSIRFSHKKGNKDIETVKPKCDWITSHTARRSFCTNEFLAGTSPKLIMKISGHKTEQAFYRYIRITQEEAAQKMQEIWAERGAMQVFEAVN
jgi:integrase